MAEYYPAPQLREFATQIISEYHPDLLPYRVEFVFRDKATRSGGHLVLGRARVVSGVQALLATPDANSSVDADFFLIEIARDQWMGASQAEREALIDHELCHCIVTYDEDTDTYSLRTRGHDVEEFIEIITRRGAWNQERAMLQEAFRIHEDGGRGGLRSIG